MKLESLGSNISSHHPSIADPKVLPQAPPATIKPKTKTKMSGLIASNNPKKTKTIGSNVKMGIRQKSKLKLKEIETDPIDDMNNIESCQSSVNFLSAMKSKGSLGKQDLKKLISNSVEKNVSDKRK